MSRILSLASVFSLLPFLALACSPAAPAQPAVRSSAAAPSEAPASRSEPTEPTPALVAAPAQPPTVDGLEGSDKNDNTVRPVLPLPADTKVLQVGDSFAGAVGIPLGKLLEEQGVHSVLKARDASYLTDWAWDGQLQKFIWKYNPDLVLITVGANELGIAEPERRERTVKKIVETIGDRPCVWIAIPLWNGEQNGLMGVIERSVAPCVFYDTNQLIDVEHMPRIADGIHPTTAARRQWAQAVLDWLQAHRAPNKGTAWSLQR